LAKISEARQIPDVDRGMQIPMSSPDLSDLEREAVLVVLNTPSLSMGREISGFEQAVGEFTGCRHAIGVSSGTAALHLAIHAAGIQEGDLVLTTPFSFVASTNAILFERGIPVYVDVDPRSGNLDPQQVREAASDLESGGSRASRWLPRQGAERHGPLKAILSVDVFGQPADADPLLEVAREHGLKLIEDSCEALGSTYKHRPAGTLGDYGMFAFYPNKQITTGEGGVLVTDDDRAAELMRALRNQGRAPGDSWLQHTHLGYNYRLDEMSAALGRVQLGRLYELMAKRQAVAELYHDRLRKVRGIEIPQVLPETTRMSWFVYVIRLAEGMDRARMIAELAARGIPARPYFAPIHLQPYMVNQFGYREEDYPVTEDLGRRGLALPFSGVMEESQVAAVCAALIKLL
jgi:perosamine synthetase